jgi:hypothetical protein
VWVHWKRWEDWTGLENSDWTINNLMESFYWIINPSHAIESFMDQGMETLFLTQGGLIRVW